MGDYNKKWLKQRVALVSQEPVLYARSIRRWVGGWVGGHEGAGWVCLAGEAATLPATVIGNAGPDLFFLLSLSLSLSVADRMWPGLLWLCLQEHSVWAGGGGWAVGSGCAHTSRRGGSSKVSRRAQAVHLSVVDNAFHMPQTDGRTSVGWLG